MLVSTSVQECQVILILLRYKNQSTLVKKEKKHTHTLEVFVFCQQLKESTDIPIDTLFLQYNYHKKKRKNFIF